MKRTAIARGTSRLKRTAKPRKARIERAVLPGREIIKWRLKRWNEAEALLREIRDSIRDHGGILAATQTRVFAFVAALRERPKLRRRSPGQARSETEYLDELVKALVLHRYGNRCLRCPEGRQRSPILHAAHLRGKGAHPSLRWELDNVIPLCEWCHITGPEAWHAPDCAPAILWARQALGHQRFENLEYLSRIRKGQRTDKKAVRLYLEQETVKLGIPLPA